MSVPAIILSGYLAGIAMRGPESHDVVEVQSRVEVKTSRVRAHAAYTLDIVTTPFSGGASASRDVAAGANVALDRVLLVGEFHALDATHGGPSGYAGYGAVGARVASYELTLGAGAVWVAGALGHQLTLRVARPRVTSRLDASATAIVTDLQLSAGGGLTLHATRRIDVALEALAGTRSRALLSEGQTIESLTGKQHELVGARVLFDVGGGGSAYVAGSVRRDTSADGHGVTVVGGVAGVAKSW